MAPKRSQATIEVTPASMRILATATPAAPAPTISTSRSFISRPVSRQLLMSAASVTIAVPCWSSWKTGMSSESCRRCSISKQRGEEMSSRLMPPKVGEMRSTVSTISSTSFVLRQIGHASTPANSLKSIDLPSITGMAASGPMSPRPSTAVPSETTATVLALIVYLNAFWRFSAIAEHTRATPGVYAIERSARDLTGMFRPVWILPLRCTSNVRSVISTTLAARTDCTAVITWPRCSTPEHSTVISRRVRSPFASTVSTATMEPPARVIAAVTLPSTPPGRLGSSTRRVSENCADGVGIRHSLRFRGRRTRVAPARRRGQDSARLRTAEGNMSDARQGGRKRAMRVWHSLIRHGGFLARGVAGADAAAAARNWLRANQSLFRLGSVDDLEVTQSSRLTDSAGHVVGFRQRFGGLPAGVDGRVTLGLRSAGGAWDVAYVSSSLAPATELSGERRLSATEAWARAAADVGRAAPGARIGRPKQDGRWSVFAVEGFAQPQRAREVAVPTPRDGVRRAWETLITDVRAGAATGFTHFIDAESGEVLIRQDNEHQSHPAAETFEGSVPQTDGACSTEGPWTVASGERVESIAAAVEATLTTNDVVLNLKRDGATVASQDTLFSPEALVYDPPDAGAGTYTLDVCDFVDGEAWTAPNTYSGQIAFNGAAGSDTATPDPPVWKGFPAYPLIGNENLPWKFPSDDIRELWCWESTEGFPPRPVTGPDGEPCDREVQNLASRLPWDVDGRTQQPTFTTDGNNASSAEAWFSPLTPGGAQRPVSLQREYVYPWQNAWHVNGGSPSGCSQSNFTPGGNDIDAAVTNLFAMHNRMHDWAYFLGFDERRWNAQESNFGTGGTAEGDPLLGDAQAGAVTGGFPSYLGRDNANMIPTPDGVPPITNMYLWQPLAGAFYAPCVDGDYDMAVIGHEYGHLVENRMIGKSFRRQGNHAGMMGESSGDLIGMEYLNEYNFVPAGGGDNSTRDATVTIICRYGP